MNRNQRDVSHEMNNERRLREPPSGCLRCKQRDPFRRVVNGIAAALADLDHARCRLARPARDPESQ